MQGSQMTQKNCLYLGKGNEGEGRVDGIGDGEAITWRVRRYGECLDNDPEYEGQSF